MYVCLFFINLICLNKVLFVIVVFSLKKCVLFWVLMLMICVLKEENGSER